jgi:acyl carrier protein phosphodiesterase
MGLSNDMNYLAHAYLSFEQPGLLAGNMISDFVKGRKKFDYSTDIQRGISLHRAIDEFTDFHPVTQAAKAYFRKDYRLYSGAFIDVVYDHFLANDRTQFADQFQLGSFCRATYTSLENIREQLPPRFVSILPYMQQQNWLYNYQFREGIERSFGGLVRRAVYLHESAIAFEIFNRHYEELGQCYEAFFPELKSFALQQLSATKS